MQSAFCLMRKPADARGLQHQRGRGVGPCLQLAVEHIQSLAVTADLITKMELFGGDSKGLYMLNSELKARVYTAPSLVL